MCNCDFGIAGHHPAASGLAGARSSERALSAAEAARLWNERGWSLEVLEVVGLAELERRSSLPECWDCGFRHLEGPNTCTADFEGPEPATYCNDCARRITALEADGTYSADWRHLEAPELGCFLIPGEGPSLEAEAALLEVMARRAVAVYLQRAREHHAARLAAKRWDNLAAIATCNRGQFGAAGEAFDVAGCLYPELAGPVPSERASRLLAAVCLACEDMRERLALELGPERLARHLEFWAPATRGAEAASLRSAVK